ncbi:MAG: MmgE/PrpD family protein, partial [Alphaproteobacteria bacterium]
MTETTRELAEFILRTNYGDLPKNVQHEAARAFLNIVGCAFGGSTSDAVGIDLGFADAYTGLRTNTVIGQDKKLDP